MKTLILVADGAADYPCPELDNRTPLQAAAMPCTRALAAAGTLHHVQSVPAELPPGSDVANLGLLGYDPTRNYTGRAPIEAAGADIPLQADEVAVRCNLVRVADETMVDYSAGHITTEAALPLIQRLQAELGRDGLTFHPGVSYRHLLVWRNGPSQKLPTTPPHDFTGLPLEPHWPQGPGAEKIKALTLASREILAGEQANQIWLWGQGTALTLQPYHERYQLSGTVVSAVDLVRGLGVLAGLNAPLIPGATGFLDTDYAAKVRTALDALRHQHFAYMHIEAPDECGHLGDPHQKTRALTDFDAQVVAPIHAEMERRAEPYQLVITMDHRTPCSLKKHSREPVPLLHVQGPTGPLSASASFDEIQSTSAAITSYAFIDNLLRGG